MERWLSPLPPRVRLPCFEEHAVRCLPPAVPRVSDIALAVLSKRKQAPLTRVTPTPLSIWYAPLVYTGAGTRWLDAEQLSMIERAILGWSVLGVRVNTCGADPDFPCTSFPWPQRCV